MKWFKAAIVRAIKSMAQMGVIALTGVVTINDVEWPHVIGACLMAGVLSLLTSMAGLPEVKEINDTDTEESN